jgi:hypothetical protein
MKKQKEWEKEFNKEWRNLPFRFAYPGAAKECKQGMKSFIGTQFEKLINSIPEDFPDRKLRLIAQGIKARLEKEWL